MIRPLRLRSDYITLPNDGILKQKYPNGEALPYSCILKAFNSVLVRFETILRIISSLKEMCL
nr:MAG TPA: hypothetical protein [Caudoviricetes sp.]